MSALIEARGVSAGYGGSAVIRDVDLTVAPGEVVALLGPNGAGKSTTLLTLAGELRPLAGEVEFDGTTRYLALHRRARRGLAFVPEERSVFRELSVRQNLAIGRGVEADRATALFAELEPLQARRGGLLSGGEQQMLSLARALSGNARLLLADELSLGLAPRTVGRLLRAVRAAADGGMGALVVEQHVHRVLDIADRVYLMRNGRVELEAGADEARARIDEIQEAYLAAGAEQRAAHHVEPDGPISTTPAGGVE